MSIYICYYIRIQTNKDRVEFVDRMTKTKKLNFLEYVNSEIDSFISKINLPPGTAKNDILKNNLFTLFVCINTKVPIFICGKPGCSKSLSVQLLFKAMRGENSTEEIFKKLPRLFINSYQGSLSSTSEGVLDVFNKARNIIRNQKTDDNFISMVYFDKMGLAEISKNNPLKVIHSQLEYDDNKDKVAFVGISNWTLDASKMNRGVFLSIIEPEEEQLNETALEIAKSFDSNFFVLVCFWIRDQGWPTSRWNPVY